MTTHGGLSVIDVDSHVYEPAAIWDEYVESAYRPLARAGFWHDVDGDGNAVTIVNGALAPELNRSRIVRQAIWRPGSRAADIGALDPTVFHELNPGAWDPLVRLSDMDELGIEQSIVFPTLFNEYLPMVQNPDVAAVLARAYNDWVFDRARPHLGRRVLDAGAGIGTFTELAAEGREVVAVEPDPEQLAILRERVAGQANVQVVEAPDQPFGPQR